MLQLKFFQQIQTKFISLSRNAACFSNLSAWMWKRTIKMMRLAADIYLFKVYNGNSRTMFAVYSKLTIRKQEWRHWLNSGVFIANLEKITHIVLVFLLLTLNKWIPARKLYWQGKYFLKMLWCFPRSPVVYLKTTCGK